MCASVRTLVSFNGLCIQQILGVRGHPLNSDLINVSSHSFCKVWSQQSVRKWAGVIVESDLKCSESEKLTEFCFGPFWDECCSEAVWCG